MVELKESEKNKKQIVLYCIEDDSVTVSAMINLFGLRKRQW